MPEGIGSQSAPLLPAGSTEEYKVTKVLSIHEQSVFDRDIMLHPDLYCSIFQPGDLVRITQDQSPVGSSSGNSFKEVIIRLPEKAPTKSKAQTHQISLSKRVATTFDFVPRREVTMERFIDEKSVEVDLLLLTFRDQYIGRADMYHIRLNLINEFVFTSRKLTFGSIHLTVQEMSNGTRNLSTGIITERTKVAFRSRSAKMFLFLQMSSEMWEFAEDSDLYFERSVNKFLFQLFSKWKQLQTNHSVTIIFFSRIYYTKKEVQVMKNDENYKNHNMPLILAGEMYYRDFYKVIVDDETLPDWFSMIKRLKQEFMKYPSLIEWEPPLLRSCTEPSSNFLSIGRNSNAYDGNFLEAINLTMSEFSKHYVNRDLKHTGQSILVISPGSGYFRVEKSLADLTKQKIIDNGVGCDLVCMGRPPLHAVPLFHYVEEPSGKHDSKKQLPVPRLPANVLSFLDGQQIYKFPFWIYISFFQSSQKNDILVSNLLESIFGWKNVNEGLYSNQEIFIPKVSCHGSYSSWMDQSHEAEVSRHSEEFLEKRQVTFPKHARSASKTFVTPTLNLRPRSTIQIDNPAAERIPKFSYDSGDSYNSSFTEALSVGSFTSEQPSYAAQPTRNKNQAVNPFELSVVSTESSSSRRWSHMYPRVTDRKKTERNVSAPNLFTSEANWKSFTEPVCLPLGTDYKPSQAELNKNYLQGAYTLSLLPGEDVYHNKMEDLLQELVSQRLAQNYQLVSVFETQSTGKTHFLALGHIFHEITYDEIAQNITVKRYHLKHKMNEVNRHYKYHYALWPVNSKLFLPSFLDIHHTGELQVNWNAVDQLICGESNTLSPSLRLWNIQLVVLPNDTLLPPTGDSEAALEAQQSQELEEKKISAFLAFTKNLFAHNRIFKNDHTLDIQIVSEQVGSSISPSSKSLGELDLPTMDTKDPNTHLSELVDSMRHPHSGLDIRDRRKTITRRTQRRCFVAEDLVYWILQNVDEISYDESKAVELAQQLLTRGFLKPVSSTSRTFEKGKSLYRFSEDQNVVNIRKASIKQKKHKPIHSERLTHKNRSNSSNLEETLIANPITPPTSEPKSLAFSRGPDSIRHHSLEYLPMRRPEYEASSPAACINSPTCQQYFANNGINSAKIQVEDRNKKTDRYQWIAIEYDKLYYPNCCYHIGIKWMICTGSSIQDVIGHLERHAKQSGVSIVQVPVEREHANSAFRSPVNIEVPIEVDKHALLLRFGFILDRKVGGSLEYMHRTGVAFIRCTDEGFVWNYNYTPTLQVQMSKAVSLLKELVDVCEDLGSDSETSEDENIMDLFATQ